MTKRRDFLAQRGGAAAAMPLDTKELRAGTLAAKTAPSAWDTSWLDRLAAAQYRVVFNGSEIADGGALELASTFLNHYHEVHGTTDDQTRPVIVFRRLGTPMAFNDAMWDKYAIGEDQKINDPNTKAPARRNIYFKAANDPGQYPPTTIEALNARGLISLVCNIATNNWASGFARKFKRDAADVQRDLKANLIPGAILVPSGIYGLIRAQNAGCAYMTIGS